MCILILTGTATCHVFLKNNMQNLVLKIKEAVAQMCSVKKVFLEISKNSQENTCARVSFLIKLQV